MELEKNNNTDEQVKAKFENFAPPVPVDLWNIIEKQLDNELPVQNKPIIRIKRAYSIYGGAIAATLIVAFAFWKFDKNETIELKRSDEVYALKAPSEGIKGELQENIDDGHVSHVHQERLAEVNPSVVVQKRNKNAEELAYMPLIVDVKPSTETSIE